MFTDMIEKNIVVQEWPDADGNDDHGRDGGGSGAKYGMSKSDMASLKPGDRLEYNDGRSTPGGKGKATVLENGKTSVKVQFDDRMENTQIAHHEKGWTDHLRKVGK